MRTEETRRAVTGMDEMRAPNRPLRDRPTGRDRRTGVTKAMLRMGGTGALRGGEGARV